MAEPALCGPKVFRSTKRLTAKRRPKSNFLTTLYQESCRCANCLGEKSLHRSQNSRGKRCRSPLRCWPINTWNVQCGMVNWRVSEAEKRLPYLKFNLRWAAYRVAEFELQVERGMCQKDALLLNAMSPHCLSFQEGTH